MSTLTKIHPNGNQDESIKGNGHANGNTSPPTGMVTPTETEP
jgi:hypothetical protein